MTGPAESGASAPIRFGVIGAGWFATRRHMPDMCGSSKVTLAALCRRDTEARNKVASKFNVPPERAFADWQEMLQTAELDAVLIATPPGLHYQQAKTALEKGLHVLLEKPMTIRSAEAWELVALAKERGLHLGVALNPPFWAHTHKMRRALRQEAMGLLESASIYWSGSAEYVFGRAPAPDNLPGIVPPTMFRADPELGGGGYCIDGGSHLLSELLWVTESPIRRLSCLMDTTPLDMRFLLSAELENGAICTINAIGDSKFSSRRVRHIFGASGGTITVNGFDFETQILMQNHEPQRFKEADLLPVASPVQNFVEVLQGKGTLYSTGEHGAQVVEVVEAAYQAVASGSTITLRKE